MSSVGGDSLLSQPLAEYSGGDGGGAREQGSGGEEVKGCFGRLSTPLPKEFLMSEVYHGE